LHSDIEPDVEVVGAGITAEVFGQRFERRIRRR
jgi:hypothetical protein